MGRTTGLPSLLLVLLLAWAMPAAAQPASAPPASLDSERLPPAEVTAGDEPPLLTTSEVAQQTARAVQTDAEPDRQEIENAARTSAQQDARIAAAVAVALARAPAIPDVGVDVNASVVTLSGSVVDDEQRTRAERLAKGVQGVTEVDNQLQLSTDLGTRVRAAAVETRAKLTRWIAGAPLLLSALVLVVLGTWLGRLVARRLSWLRLDARNPYLNQLISRVLQWIITVAAIVMALDLLGATKLVGALLGSAGVIGLALGFAFRDIAENYIAGIMLSVRRPFAPGDFIDVDGKEGRVVSLSPRATILMTMDGNHLRLPNAMVFKAVILNYSANPKRRIKVRTDIDAAESIAEAEAAALRALGKVDGILDDPPPRLIAREYGSAGTIIELQAWVDQTRTDFVRASSAAVQMLKAEFAEAGIEPTRTTQFIVDAGAASIRPPPKPEPTQPSTDTDASDDLGPQLRQAQAEQAQSNLIAQDCSREE